jgi:hypothetical protein
MFFLKLFLFQVSFQGKFHFRQFILKFENTEQKKIFLRTQQGKIQKKNSKKAMTIPLLFPTDSPTALGSLTTSITA